MNIFFTLVGVSFAGILVVFWLLRNENKPSLRNFGAPSSPVTPLTERPSLFAGRFVKPVKPAKKTTAGDPLPTVKSSTPPRARKPSLLAGLVAKFKKEKKETTVTVPLPSVTDFVERSFVVYQDKSEADPAASQVVLSAAEEKKIEQEIDLAAQIQEWKEKYERLDNLFNEKSAALEKSEESLNTELNTRKEFNKLKDILEKELREAKDKARNIQGELNAARTEAEGSRKRIAQLEDKAEKMEKVILERDDEISALNKVNKRLQAAASVPVVAAASEPAAPTEPPADPAIPETSAAPVAVVPAEPPPASPLEKPELEQGKEAGEPKQSSDPALPEANSQGPQDKPASEGQTNQQDEQKKE